MFGSLSQPSLNSLEALTNKYNLPFVTWSSPSSNKILNDENKFQIYLSPDLYKLLNALINHYKWNSSIFYIYNYEAAVFMIESLTNSNANANIQKEIFVRKIQSINNVADILK